VGTIILGFKLHDIEKNTLYLVAAILFIVDIFIPILNFVAWTPLYIALDKSSRNSPTNITNNPTYTTISLIRFSLFSTFPRTLKFKKVFKRGV